NTYTWQRESNAEITSKEGFSVVAPINVTNPRSTAPRRESCCDFEKRWISSMNKMGCSCWKLRSWVALSMTSRTSFTPELMAVRLKKGRLNCVEIIDASVVLPTPGGPHKIMEGMFC